MSSIVDSKDCLRCRTTFRPKRRASKFCKETCRVGWYRDNNSPTPPPKPCIHCGMPCPKGRQKLCGSDECQKQADLACRARTKPCIHEDCDRPSHCKGYCPTHYYRYQREHEKRFTLTCDHCGTTYAHHRGPRGETYCSKECSGLALADQLNTPEVRARQQAGYRKYVQELRDSRSTEVDIYHIHPALQYCKEAITQLKMVEQQKTWRSQRGQLRAAWEDQDHTAFINAVQAKTIADKQGCWVWQGKTKSGYPEAILGGRYVAIHRAVLEAKHGAPLGSQAAHHMCANRGCVNPEHLQPVTHRDNIAEMLARHSYLNRIKELEQALKDLAPNHQLLKNIEVA